MARTKKELDLACLREYRHGIHKAYDLCSGLYHDKVLLPDSDDVGIISLERHIRQNLYEAMEKLELAYNQARFLKNMMEEA